METLLEGQPVEKLLATEIYGNGFTDWGVAALLCVAVLAIALLVRLFLVRRLPAGTWHWTWDD